MQNLMTRVAPVLGVPRVRQAAEYYRDVFGFSLDPNDGVFQPSPTEPDGVYAIVKLDNIWIHFQIRRGEFVKRDRTTIERDAYFYVNDVEKLQSDFERRGANIIQGLLSTPYGIREFVVEDLNGFRLVFGQTIS